MAGCDRYRLIVDVDRSGNLVGVAYEAYRRGDRVALSTQHFEPFDQADDALRRFKEWLDADLAQGALFD